VVCKTHAADLCHEDVVVLRSKRKREGSAAEAQRWRRNLDMYIPIKVAEAQTPDTTSVHDVWRHNRV
jgi:hypothetical protein